MNVPVKVELVNILTIFELTAGRDFKDPAKIESMVASSIFHRLIVGRNDSFANCFLSHQDTSSIARILRSCLEFRQHLYRVDIYSQFATISTLGTGRRRRAIMYFRQLGTTVENTCYRRLKSNEIAIKSTQNLRSRLKAQRYDKGRLLGVVYII